MRLILYKTLFFILEISWKFWHIKSRRFFEKLWVKLKFADREYNAKLPTCVPCCNPNAENNHWQTNLCSQIEGIKYDVESIVESIKYNPEYKIKINEHLWWVKPFIRARR